MHFFTYILQSQIDRRFYIGQSQNLLQRLKEHNSGKSKYTKAFCPWALIWYKTSFTRAEAFRLEQKIKSFKSRSKTITFINDNPCIPGADNPQISDLID